MCVGGNPHIEIGCRIIEGIATCLDGTMKGERVMEEESSVSAVRFTMSMRLQVEMKPM